ncbi:prolyl oligopeptidase family serine peptidase [Marinospirillum sp.]|uniref:extracellular catalytic domain type 2 short-chain-length polyhydroxyalkanoate depolymerase n=1 Tax=Marinospirillum sp. TaxID=2183934 RepID=UPI003A8618B1
MQRKFKAGLIAGLMVALAGCSSNQDAAPALPELGTNPERLYLAGLSSGGYMAHQLHLAWPEQVQGVAIFAAGPYGCARGGLVDALQRCMFIQRGAPQAATSLALIEEEAAAGNLGDPQALAGDRVFLYHGLGDRVVHPRVGEALQATYQQLVGDQLHVHQQPQAGHGLPTLSTGVDCAASAAPYVNACGFAGAAVSMAHLDGAPRGASELTASVQSFDQRPFFEDSRGLADQGYYYQPAACAADPQSCGLVMVLHGCDQAAEQVGLAFIEQSGYLEAAEAHQLVVLFPQARSRTANPKACWDWWGLESRDYDTRTGRQMRALHSLWQAAQVQEAPRSTAR